jgi:hypothetical protein
VEDAIAAGATTDSDGSATLTGLRTVSADAWDLELSREVDVGESGSDLEVSLPADEKGFVRLTVRVRQQEGDRAHPFVLARRTGSEWARILRPDGTVDVTGGAMAHGRPFRDVRREVVLREGDPTQLEVALEP